MSPFNMKYYKQLVKALEMNLVKCIYGSEAINILTDKFI